MTFRSRTLYQLSYNGKNLKIKALQPAGAEPVTFRSRTLYQLSYNGLRSAANCAAQKLSYETSGGRGRIRTSVARKERQIYSLLPLAARPPVRPFTRSDPTKARFNNAGKL